MAYSTVNYIIFRTNHDLLAKNTSINSSRSGHLLITLFEREDLQDFRYNEHIVSNVVREVAYASVSKAIE